MIRTLNVNNAHGHDDISIRMIKTCDESVAIPLSKTFRNYLNSCIYPSTWKKANVTLIQKKKWQAMFEQLSPCVASTSI